MAPPRRTLGTIASVQPGKRQVRIALRKGYRAAAEKLNTIELELRDGEAMRCRVQKVTCDADSAHVVLVAGVTRENVARMRGATVFAPDAAEPDREGAFDVDDLLGFEVVESDETLFGTVASVMDTKAGGILNIETTAGRRVLLPAIPEAISGIDWDAERIVVNDIAPYAVGTDEE